MNEAIPERMMMGPRLGQSRGLQEAARVECFSQDFLWSFIDLPSEVDSAILPNTTAYRFCDTDVIFLGKQYLVKDRSSFKGRLNVSAVIQNGHDGWVHL